MDMRLRRDVGARDQVVAEVALPDAPLLDGDVAAKRVAQPPDPRAPELRAHTVGIDHEAAIERNVHARNGDLAVVAHADMHDRRRVSEEAAVDGDSPPLP